MTQERMSVPKLIYRVHEARKALGVSTATIYRMCARGELEKAPIGLSRAVGISAASIEAVVRRMQKDLATTVDSGSQIGSQTDEKVH